MHALVKYVCSAAVATALSVSGAVMAQTNDYSLQGIEARVSAEAKAQSALPQRMQYLIRISALTALGANQLLRQDITQALDAGINPNELYEAIVQGMAYSGLARAIDAATILEDIAATRGMKVDPQQGTVTDDSRFADGLKAQQTIFGVDNINAMQQAAPQDEHYLKVEALSAFCFGDSYTRKVLTLKERELLTFCYITALGGNWPQVKAHTGGNLNMGTTREELIGAIEVMMPLIGFPKTLNALAFVGQLPPPKEAGA